MTSRAALLHPRAPETAHFGAPVHAASVESADDVATVLEQAQDVADGLVVIRAAARATPAIHALERSGALLCDALITLSMSVPSSARASANAGAIRIRAGSPSDADALQQLGGEAFRGHTGHWHADPRIPVALADMLYAKWSADLARGSDDAHPLLVVEHDAMPIAFLALARNEPAAWSVPLTCVAPAQRGRGALRAMLDAACDVIARAGGGRLDYETQVTNVAALQAVTRAGFVPTTARLTFHLWMGAA